MKAIVLAGERPGGSPLAEQLGVAASVLASVAGLPSIARVVATLRCAGCIDGGVIAGPELAVRNRSKTLETIFEPGDYTWVEPAAGPAESALRALDELDAYPVLVTTGDHALLTAATVERFVAAATSTDAQAVVGLAPYQRVMQRFPGASRTRLRFREGSYCGTNLFLLRSREARGAALFWPKVQRDRKRPWRIAGQLGGSVVLRYLTGRLGIRDAFAALSRITGCSIGWVEVGDPLAAVDVDSAADLAIAEQVLGCWNEAPKPRLGVQLGKLVMRAADRFLARHSRVPTTPFLPSEDFLQIPPLEAHWQAIRDELDQVLQHPEDIPTFHENVPRPGAHLPRRQLEDLRILRVRRTHRRELPRLPADCRNPGRPGGPAECLVLHTGARLPHTAAPGSDQGRGALPPGPAHPGKGARLLDTGRRPGAPLASRPLPVLRRHLRARSTQRDG